MLGKVERTHPLDCATRHDTGAAMVKAEVERRDAAARTAREQAIAEALALRARQAAAELARAEKLAVAAYLKARDRNWAETRRLELADTRKSQDEHLATPDLRDPSKDIVNVLPRGAASTFAAAASRSAQRTRPPELPDWRQVFVVGAASYDCGFKDGAVTCNRRSDERVEH